MLANSRIVPDTAQYVYTMHGVNKVVPPKRVILKGILLSFFPGAKIGVLGLNGSGKSSLLKIMAGVDQDIEGDAEPMPNLHVGFLPPASRRARALKPVPSRFLTEGAVCPESLFLHQPGKS